MGSLTSLIANLLIILIVDDVVTKTLPAYLHVYIRPTSLYRLY